MITKKRMQEKEKEFFESLAMEHPGFASLNLFEEICFQKDLKWILLLIPLMIQIAFVLLQKWLLPALSIDFSQIPWFYVGLVAALLLVTPFYFRLTSLKKNYEVCKQKLLKKKCFKGSIFARI